MRTLFVWDSHAEMDAQAIDTVAQDLAADEDVRSYARHMAEGVWETRESIDRWIDRLAPQWPVKRQPAVDRTILRLAVWELTNTVTPPKVVLDEAIELAKEYSTENSGSFVNGVLDTVLREIEQLTSGPVGASGQPTAAGPLVLDRTEEESAPTPGHAIGVEDESPAIERQSVEAAEEDAEDTLAAD